MPASEIGAKSLKGSYGVFSKSGPSQSVLLATSSVFPSGAARATISPGMTLEGRLSTIAVRPSRSWSDCASRRATKSFPPPIAVVTMRSGRLGVSGAADAIARSPATIRGPLLQVYRKPHQFRCD